jgi:hypothetical protein
VRSTKKHVTNVSVEGKILIRCDEPVLGALNIETLQFFKKFFRYRAKDAEALSCDSPPKTPYNTAIYRHYH